MKDVPADTPFIFFHWLICVSPLRDFVGGHGMLICSAGHDRPSRACSAPSSMPNDLKYKAIVAKRCRGVQVETHPLPQEFIYPFTSSHRVHECGQSCLLCRCQAIPFVQHFALRRGKRNTRILFCKKLRQCNTKSIAYLFERCKRRCHRFFVPRGDGRLWQARAFSKLIFRPSPCLTISFDDFQNICHNFTT